ncbi:toprim domain-containing protein [Enterococcus sp. DIV0187]|uniref:toprim domain-containing protein n=1 Tax=Enterococcus sp. DIV0187 TaxID=2774644 RepID=UPI003F26AC3F
MEKDKIMRSHAERQKLVQEAHEKNIVDVALSLGMGLVREGRNFSWDQHDSFMINTKKNAFYWNSQGFGGDSIKLVQTMTDCSFKEAVSYLTGSEIAAAKIDTSEPKEFRYFLKDHKMFSTGRKYLNEERLISNETIDQLLSQGALAQSSYTDMKTNKTQPVIVFKAMDDQRNIKGISVQGVWEQKGQKRPYLKKTHGDGFSGFMVKVGNPPTGQELSEENPLKIIAFEAPIDLISYYELFQKDLGNAILLSMNGLRKGTISKCLANQLGSPVKEKDKPDFLDDLNKRMQPNKLIQIVLAVDNDKAGRKFINEFGAKNISVTPQIPALMEGETKSDWNQVLQRLKKPVKEPFKSRVDQAAKETKQIAKEEKQQRINPVAKPGEQPRINPVAKPGEQPRINPVARPGKQSRINPVARQAEPPRINPSVTLK